MSNKVIERIIHDNVDRYQDKMIKLIESNVLVDINIYTIKKNYLKN